MKLFVWAKHWFTRRLRAARRSLRAHGVSSHLMPIGYEVDWSSIMCRMYAVESTIYVSGWWMVVGYIFKQRITTERLFRHELAHTIVYSSGMEFPEYPPRREMLKREIQYALRGFRDYGKIHPEEEFAVKVSDFDREALHRVASLR